MDNGEGNGTPLQYSCLENPMDGGAWWAAVHGVAKSWTRLSDLTFTFHFHALEKEVATHSSVLSWRIPETGEPVGLPSMGSHRVGHDWSDLAAAAAGLDNAYMYWWELISEPRLPRQMIITSRNSITDTPRNNALWLIRASLAQSSWHIKLSIMSPHNIQFAFQPLEIVQFSGMQCIYNVVQPSPASQGFISWRPKLI